MIIRNEAEKDFRAVEELTKTAFWNVNVPSCDEHYLVHVLRGHPDFVPELDFVLEEDGKIIGNILYTRAKLVDEEGNEKNVLTFGRRGYGKKLQTHSFARAVEMGYDTVVIFGNPENYVATGFKNGKRFHVGVGDVYPVALLVKELTDGALDGRKWRYVESAAYAIDEAAAEAFDRDFPQMEKAYLPSQELFYIYSHATVTR